MSTAIHAVKAPVVVASTCRSSTDVATDGSVSTTLQELPKKRDLTLFSRVHRALLFLRISGFREVDRKCQYAFGLEARVNTAQIEKTSHQETGTDQEDHRQGHFRNHQGAAQAIAADAFDPALALL